MKKVFKIFITISVLSVISSCGSNNDMSAKKTKLEKLKAQRAELSDKIKALEEEIASGGDTSKSTEKMKDVIITKIEPQIFLHNIDVQGRVESDENITISTKMGGTVTKVNVAAGSVVKAGEILAEIDNDLVKTQIADLKNSWDLANEMFQKQKALWDQKIGTEMQYLQAKSNKESLEKKMATLNEQLDMYRIKAPFNGTIDDVSIKLGQTVGPGVPAIRLINFNKLKVKADLAESYAAKIKTGNPVHLFFPDINKTETSKVSYDGRVINTMTRTFDVEMLLPSGEEYRPNMVAEVSITDYVKNDAIVVPVNTIQNIDDKDYVYVANVENGKKVARKRLVEVGETYESNAEIKSGIQPGDLVITTGYSNLNDGELIKF